MYVYMYANKYIRNGAEPADRGGGGGGKEGSVEAAADVEVGREEEVGPHARQRAPRYLRVQVWELGITIFSWYTQVYSVIYDSGSIPRRVIFSSCETSLSPGFTTRTVFTV